MGVRVVQVIVVGGLLALVGANSDDTAHTSKSQENIINTRTPLIKLVDEPHCKEDIQRVCKNDVRNNFAVLECLQNEKRTDKGIISEDCNHMLWTYKLNLTQSGRIEDLAKNVCDGDLSNNNKIQCKDTRAGHTISCMTEHLDLIKDERCHAYLVRLAAIVFSDYRLVEEMTQKCSADIAKFKCGRLESNQEAPHSQGITIECLGKHVQNLTTDCHKEILRLSELQADDFHLDRALFFACRYDREQFCENVRAGDGKVYKCLMKHKTERKMSTECADQLTRRQELVAQDYRVSKGLVNACRQPIKENFCRRGAGDDEHDVKLSKILLCLESALRKGKHLEGSCQEEMLSHRRMLMEDYKLSPDLVVACREEVKNLCHAGLEADGRTLHCLMKHARNHRTKNRIGETCQHQVELLVKEADVGEDWRADPVLYEACQPMVEAACKDLRGGQARVMRCLMRHLQSPSMPSECEAALLEIQYFVARDWKLDPQIYTACYNDSVKYCHAKKDWHDTSNSDNVDKGTMVLPCLFRYAYHPREDHRLTPTCLREVQHVMSERAAYVELHPEIENHCMHDLTTKCSENTGPGEEIVCLQDNLEKLEGECKSVVFNYTEAEAKDAGLNALLQMHCSMVIKQMCAGETGMEGGLMQCLISHKNSQVMRNNNKCRAVVENFQILSLKDISFTPKFKDQCQADVAQYCNNPKPKTKLDVLDCLSTSVREDILKEVKPRISRSCRQQLRQQLLQRHEAISLDPQLKMRCGRDIETKCSKVEEGGGKVLECLRSHKGELSHDCHVAVFVREQEEHLDPGTDVVLENTCRQMISRFCQDAQPQNLLTCLKSNRGATDFEARCRMLVTRRLVEQSTDQRLNPELRKACKVDMAKFCSRLFDQSMKSDVEFNGKVTECLKMHLPSHKLSGPCAAKMVNLMHSAALNYKLDPVLQEKCMGEMKKLCPDQLGSDGQGSMEECMKLAFENSKILDDSCRSHIAELIEVQHADIHMDPLLHRDCSQDDTKFCADEEHGEHLSCLLDVLERNPSALQVRCREILRSRREMYQAALKVTRLETVQDVVALVKASPQKNYFIGIFLMGIAIIFVGGLFCGRTTKRYRLLKDR